MSDTQGTTRALERAMPTNADLLAEIQRFNAMVARDVAGLLATVEQLAQRITALEAAR